METKGMAQEVERNILSLFDYAWNKGRNGARRSCDILAKLFKDWPAADRTNLCTQTSSGTRWMLFGTKRVGITVEGWRPEDHSNFSRSEKSKADDFWYFLKKKPHEVLAATVQSAQQSSGFTTLKFTGVRCGVLTEKGVPCNALPVKGRKRCLVHKGMRVRGIPTTLLHVTNQIMETWRPEDHSNFLRSEKSKVGNFWYFLKKQPHEVLAATVQSAQQSSGFTTLEITGVRCGVLTEKGVPCNALPVKGRKRCLVHKGMRVRGIPTTLLPVTNQITAGSLNNINTQKEVVKVSDQGTVCLPRGLLFGRSFSLNSSKDGKVAMVENGEGKRPKNLSSNSWVKLDCEGRIRVHNNSDPRRTNSLQTESS